VSHQFIAGQSEVRFICSQTPAQVPGTNDERIGGNRRADKRECAEEFSRHLFHPYL
jgi:hypothetical protein